MKLLVFLWMFPIILAEDTPVTCVFSGDCVLPCSSLYSDIIHWYQNSTVAHSYFDHQDQLEYQGQGFKNRTSLFSVSEIQKGNASLLLKNISVQDAGRYKCYTANELLYMQMFVMVSVEAPLREVSLRMEEDTVVCQTSRVYPKPQVRWSLQAPEAENSHISQDKDFLFTVRSEITAGPMNNSFFDCSFSNTDGKILYRAILQQTELPLMEMMMLECVVPAEPYFLTLRSSSFTILQYNSSSEKTNISDIWKHRATFFKENTTVKLQQMHAGTFTCETTGARSIYTVHMRVTESELRHHVCLVGVLLCCGVVAAVVCCRWKRKRSELSTSTHTFRIINMETA